MLTDRVVTLGVAPVRVASVAIWRNKLSKPARRGGEEVIVDDALGWRSVRTLH
jgi:hypothetical protein